MEKFSKIFSLILGKYNDAKFLKIYMVWHLSFKEAIGDHARVSCVQWVSKYVSKIIKNYNDAILEIIILSPAQCKMTLRYHMILRVNFNECGLKWEVSPIDSPSSYFRMWK